MDVVTALVYIEPIRNRTYYVTTPSVIAFIYIFNDAAAVSHQGR